MAELVKPWNDGGNLSISYGGDRDGSAVFFSDTNDGIDREMPVFFKGGGLTIERRVRQLGLREEYIVSDEQFITSDGEIFCVKKQ